MREVRFGLSILCRGCKINIQLGPGKIEQEWLKQERYLRASTPVIYDPETRTCS